MKFSIYMGKRQQLLVKHLRQLSYSFISRIISFVPPRELTTDYIEHRGRSTTEINGDRKVVFDGKRNSDFTSDVTPAPTDGRHLVADTCRIGDDIER